MDWTGVVSALASVATLLVAIIVYWGTLRPAIGNFLKRAKLVGGMVLFVVARVAVQLGIGLLVGSLTLNAWVTIQRQLSSVQRANESVQRTNARIVGMMETIFATQEDAAGSDTVFFSRLSAENRVQAFLWTMQDPEFRASAVQALRAYQDQVASEYRDDLTQAGELLGELEKYVFLLGETGD